MRTSEKGYATLSVLALMTALSLLVLGYLNLSNAEARKLDGIADQIAQDLGVDSAFNTTVVNLLARTLPVDNTWRAASVSGQDFDVRVQFENSKTDLNRATIERIEGALRKDFGIHLGEAYLQILLSAAPSNGLRFSDMAEFRDHFQNSPSVECLRENYTIFQSTAVLNTGRNRQNFATDGSIVRVQILDQTGRGLDTTLLFTGKNNDPYWVLDWNRYQGRKEVICDGEE